jgi:unsaturated rhamnogalacturonyl hydrolase
VLKKVFNYLDAVTPAQFMDKTTNIVVKDLSKIDTNTVFQTADFRLTSYEWGVTYAGMLLQGKQRVIRCIRTIRRNVCILLRMHCLHLPNCMQNIQNHQIPSGSRLRRMRLDDGARFARR